MEGGRAAGGWGGRVSALGTCHHARLCKHYCGSASMMGGWGEAECAFCVVCA